MWERMSAGAYFADICSLLIFRNLRQEISSNENGPRKGNKRRGVPVFVEYRLQSFAEVFTANQKSLEDRYLAWKDQQKDLLRLTDQLVRSEAAKGSGKGVSFTCRTKPRANLTSDGTVIFDTLLHYEGGQNDEKLGLGYNSTTGAFIVPRDGTYVFHISVLTNRAPFLKINGKIFRIFLGGKTDNYRSGSLIQYLVRRDSVSVAINYSAEKMHVDWSFFTGYLLYS